MCAGLQNTGYKPQKSKRKKSSKRAVKSRKIDKRCEQAIHIKLKSGPFVLQMNKKVSEFKNNM